MFLAGIQWLKTLDPGQNHAGMTLKWESNGLSAYVSILGGEHSEMCDWRCNWYYREKCLTIAEH